VIKRNAPRVRLEDKAQIEIRIKELETKIAQKEEELKQFQPNTKKLQEVANEKRANLNKLRGGVFFTNAESKDFIEKNEKKLQEEIQRLEARLETESLSIAEEKVVVRDIKKMKGMKQNFQPYQKRALEYKVAQDKLSEELRKGQREQKKIEEWKEDILAFKADLVAVAEKQKEAQKKVEEDKKKQDNQTAIEKDEKQKLIDKIDALAVKLRQEKENLRIKRDEWYESKRQARNKKIEEQNQERAEKRKENEHFEEEKILQRRQEKKTRNPS